MSVAATSDTETVCFGPFYQVLETQDSLGNETPFRGIGDALAPVAEGSYPVDLLLLFNTLYSRK